MSSVPLNSSCHKSLYPCDSYLFSTVTFFFTVTLHVAFFPEPSAAFAVIVAVPGAIAFTTPFAETVATFLLLDVQLNVLLVADAGATVAVRVLLLPSVIVSVAAESLIEVTGCFTVILHLAYLPLPSIAFAVIYTVPTLTAFTTPFEETVAILLSDDDH